MPSIIPTLSVADVAKTMRFYTETLGFETGFTMPDGSGVTVMGSVKLGDAEIMFGRIEPANAHDQAPLGRGVSLYTTVDDDKDIDALFAHAKQAGATVTQEPTDQFWGHRDWGVTDPDGYVVIISKVVAQVTEASMREAMAGAPA